ncbi:MAG: hypothetical protein AMXMBFR84_16150 [Candidatus Hydrogenedentota bacterium]
MRSLELDRSSEYLALLDERLPKQTLRHVLSVTELMNRLVDICDLHRETALVAALFHDYCKAMKGKTLLMAAARYGIPILPAWRERPMLLHGPVAAEEIRFTLGIDDPEVYEAIYNHTFGKPGMGRVGLALYVADFAEELRTHPEAAVARRILEQECFDAALRYVVDAKLDMIKKKDRPIDPQSQEFRAWVWEGCPA